MNVTWAADLAATLDNPFLQAVVAACGTFILEDATSIACGVLVAEGKMDLAVAYLGVAAGIVIGDLGLYAIGRICGKRLVKWGWLSVGKMDRAHWWFERNVVTAVVLSRIVPGARTPTYLAAGVFAANIWKFLATAIVASLAWTALLMWIVVSLGDTVLPRLGAFKWPLAVLGIVAFVCVQTWLIRRGNSELDKSGTGKQEPVVSFFEFWPPWLFYIPVGIRYAYLALKHRGLMLPMNVNPSIHSSGVARESKSQILSLVSPAHRDTVAPWIAVARRAGAVDDALLDRIDELLRRGGVSWPLVAKPDVGQRGAGVRPVRTRAELRWYLERFPAGETLILQELVPWEGEAGVMYFRLPGSSRAFVPSITLKKFPHVVGDGKSTLRELILADPRAKRISNIYLTRHRARLGWIVPAGKKFKLVFSGNHCQGTIFRNGTRHATPAMIAAFDRIARSMPEFHFGRFDVRFRDLESLKRGEGFRIVEINGAAGEATHIWDARMTLCGAWRALFRQLDVLFEIGARNRRRGFAPIALRAFISDVLAMRRTISRYPSTL